MRSVSFGLEECKKTLGVVADAGVQMDEGWWRSLAEQLQVGVSIDN